MARTRGGGVGGERRRPTASVRRQRVAEVIPEVIPEDDRGQEEHMDPDIPVGGEDVAIEHESFPGGPVDSSVLTGYMNHVALRVWTGEERPELKLASHGRKVSKFGEPAAEIEGLVASTGLSPLVHTSVETGDRGLLSAFVERWHPETSSFHLPVGEVTITLDDVASLLHLPIVGALQTYDPIDTGEAMALLVELLAVTVDDAKAEMEQCHGAYVRLSWLRDLYATKCAARQWVEAARAYLLHLVGCTLFANKSSTHISVVFLDAFRDLDQAAGYAWGVAALVHMYENLNYACQHHGKHLAGYISLLQCWIYEHFPTIGSVSPDPKYDERFPRACRWKAAKALPVSTYRRRLDRMTLDDVCWTPYRDHRAHRDLEIISLFGGYVRWGPHIVRHRPDRVLRQFGFVLHIPQLDASESPSIEQVDDKWMHFSEYLVDIGDLVTFPSQFGPGYMDWYHRISHPYMLPPEVGEPSRHHVHQPSLVTDPLHVSQDDRPPTASDVGHTAPHAVGMCERLADGLQHMLDTQQVVAGTEAYSSVQHLLGLARSVTPQGNVFVRTSRLRHSVRRRVG